MPISVPDFTKAIQSLHDTWNSVADLGGSSWQEITIVKTQALNAVPYLRLTKHVANPEPPSTASQASEHEEQQLHEPDPESLPPPPSHQPESLTITYTIIHSPTYLVPVLYISLPTSLPFLLSSPITADSLYTLLVLPLYRPSLQNPRIGILGGLTATTHPETGRSCFWIHPCLTQEGMVGLGLEGDEGGVEYMMAWLGLVGGGVGLEVPVEVARKVLRKKDPNEREGT